MFEQFVNERDRIDRNDSAGGDPQNPNVPRKISTPPQLLSHRWFLPEWAKELGKRQRDAQHELGWAKASASDLWNGKQRYTQDLVDEVATWLGILPFELLMPPAQALALRRLRQSAAAIVAEQGADWDGPPSPPEDDPGR